MRYLFIILGILGIGFSFGFVQAKQDHQLAATEVAIHPVTHSSKNTLHDSSRPIRYQPGSAGKVHVDPELLVAYAKTLLGTPYLYASTDPSKGFDCSGFINYVMNHFGIAVPRSSVDFVNAGATIDRYNARPGDLILFTGTDTTNRIVGHIGMITENNNGNLQFIHSSSGKANGVTMSFLEGYYETRFVKIVRIGE